MTRLKSILHNGKTPGKRSAFRIGTLVGALTGVLVLGGCGLTYDYSELRNKEIQGDDFSAQLAREYKSFALSEKDEMSDYPDAAYFAEKSERAWAGALPKPEEPGRWFVFGSNKKKIVLAHGRLVTALRQATDLGILNGKAAGPAARAQARYDCWVEQLDEGHQPDHIQRCQSGCWAAVSVLEGLVELASDQDQRFGFQKTIYGKNSGKAPVVSRLPSSSYTLYFDFDRGTLKNSSDKTLTAIADTVREDDRWGIDITGHADRVGTDHYNLGLSHRRAEAVRYALIKRGVEADRISLSAMGESVPFAKTIDGRPAPKNRRTEVIVGQMTKF